MAEALLRARLVDVAPAVTVGSAGLLFDGRPAEPNAVKAMSRYGLDISTHTAQKISLELLQGASLILGMERQHVREVAALDAALFPRSFTLPELVNLGEIGDRRPGQSLDDWVHEIGAVRSPDGYAASDPRLEIADPMGRSLRAFRACAVAIDQSVTALVASAWPTPPPSDHPVAPAPSGGIHADRDRR